jgi:hypothetical protein
MSDDQSQMSRRNALKCLAYGGAGTLFALSGGVFTPIDLAMAADDKRGAAALGKPLWSIYEPWGWGTGDADQLMSQLRRFGSVTVLNGHIHQIVQKVEGNVTFHTARSTAYSQPAAGEGSGPGPLKVPADELGKLLGVTSVSVVKHPASLALNDSTIA